MKKSDIIKYIEDWAPGGAAWQKDNPGLQAGYPEHEVKNILICLEVTQRTIKEAIRKNCNLIISHHPLIFNPLRRITPQNDKTSEILSELIKNNITLFSAHTNLDFTKDGVSFQLAKRLELQKVRFLKNLEGNQKKLVVFVPTSHLNEISSAIFKAGGGIIGEYSGCSFRLSGEGTFFGSDNTNPAVGSKGKFEKVEEVRLETIVNNWNLKKVLSALLKAHPYEEPAYDIYPLDNKNVNFGMGAIGELQFTLSTDKFLEFISTKLNIKNLRYTTGKKQGVKKVAVCGGSGGDLLFEAISSGADAFITADIKYHTFHDAEGKILLIDAGHFETEVVVLDEIKKRIENYAGKGNPIKIYTFSKTNPIKNFNVSKGVK